jgi:hypothetical protein
MLELVAFYFAMVIWLSQITQLAGLWWHLLHVPRAFIGVLLIAKLPNTHELI